MGVSGPGPADIEARHAVGLDRFMWGSDYPHDEGTHPHTKEHLRRRFAEVDPTTTEKMLYANAAKLYDFDLDALAPLAEQYGLTREEMHTPIVGGEDPTLRDKMIGDDMNADAL